MTRKMFLLLVATVWMVACSMGNQVEKSSNHVMQDTAQLVNRVNEIYADVIGYYEYMRSPRARQRLTGIKPPALRFCTRDWNNWLEQVANHDANHVQDGEMGFFDADYWIMGQDWGDLAVSDVHVITMTDSVATVEFNLHNLAVVTAVRLELSHERGAWLIDNFIDMTHGLDWKASMKEYLLQDGTNH